MNKKLGRRRLAALTERPQISAVPASEPSKSLFHYTTAAGLIGIIRTQNLRATHANFLNDTAECQLLTSLLAPQIATEFKDIVPRLTKLGAFKPEMLTAMVGDAMDTEAQKVANVALTVIERVSPIYISSFCIHSPGSAEHEHGLLSQWRGYGRGGFAIEFDEFEIDKLTNLENEKHSYSALITREVAYGNHREVAQLERFKGLAAASLKVSFEHYAPKLAAQPPVAEILGDREIGDFMKAFMETLAFLKSPRFREENEYRIVAMATVPGQERANDLRYKTIRFREGPSGNVVPYIELFDDPGMFLPIKKIIVGPHRDQENQYNATKLLLAEHNLHQVPVMKSDTTLRS
jgi:hypothetical protein